MKYRKKPLIIEAWPVRQLIDSASGDWKTLPLEVSQAYERGEIVFVGYEADGALSVKTPEGNMKAGISDWLIYGVKSELYPCKPDIFEATYEPVV